MQEVAAVNWFLLGRWLSKYALVLGCLYAWYSNARKTAFELASEASINMESNLMLIQKFNVPVLAAYQHTYAFMFF